ncbi:MAG TPA: hypothetical protein VLE99_01585 [Candidatus Saccharimonadales bacterium]|nr:hypothetical protein [Candidatus Saccharimonadales bacterium]
MDRITTSKLNLAPRSDEELHSVLTGFELKWQNKARRLQGDSGRISRF